MAQENPLFSFIRGGGDPNELDPITRKSYDKIIKKMDDEGTKRLQAAKSPEQLLAADIRNQREHLSRFGTKDQIRAFNKRQLPAIGSISQGENFAAGLSSSQRSGLQDAAKKAGITGIALGTKVLAKKIGEKALKKGAEKAATKAITKKAGEQALKSGTKAGMSGATMGASLAGDITGGIIDKGGTTTSTGAGASGGALKGASTGASVGSMVMPGIGTAVGAGVGAAVGGLVGGLKARARRKKALGDIEAQKQAALSQIEGARTKNINAALANLGAQFSRSLIR